MTSSVSRAQPSTAGGAELQSLPGLLENAQALVAAYQRSPFKKKDPETVKAYARLSARLTELEELLPPAEEPASHAVASLLRRITKDMNRDLVWDIAEQLKVTLLTISPAARLSALLEAELALDKRSAGGTADVAVRGRRSDVISWATLFGGHDLGKWVESLRSKGADESQLAVIRSHLAVLYEARIDHWRHERAFIQLRTNYLHAISVLLSGVLAMFGVLTGYAGGPVAKLGLACSAGAMGAVFTGLFKVRDEMQSIRQLRSFSPILIAQPLVGATSAAVVFIAFQTGVVQLGSIKPHLLAWHHHAMLGFLAGFSEAFLLGIVGRLAAATDERPKPPSSASKDRQA